jgi:hypothetical protein
MPVFLATWEAEIVRIMVQGETQSQPMLGVVVHTCHPSYSKKHKLEDHKPAWAKKWDSVSKISRATRAGGVTQVVQHLLSKKEALSLKTTLYHPLQNSLFSKSISILTSNYNFKSTILLTDFYQVFLIKDLECLAF